MITSENYVEYVLKTESKPTQEIKDRLQDERLIRMLHAAIGLATESGELLDMLKKHIFYGKPIDWVNAKEETGDAAWYLGIAIDEMKTTMNEILTMNIEKLKLRFKNKFTEQDALNRDLDRERDLLEGEEN